MISVPCFPLSHDFGRGFVLRDGYTLGFEEHGYIDPPTSRIAICYCCYCETTHAETADLQ